MKSVASLLNFRSPSQPNIDIADLPTLSASLLGRTQPTVRSTYPSVSPHHSNDSWWYRNLNLLSIAYDFRPQLRPRLTLSGRTFLRKPWVFGGWDSHPSFVTHANILSRVQSTKPYDSASTRYTMLLYHTLRYP